jgi:hypothetical protein
VFAFDEAGGFDGAHDGGFAVAGYEFLVFVLLSGLFEQHDAVVLH